jgi:class 3 adenylate cyclase
MEENEEATHRTLTSYRKLIDSLIEQHHGRFVNSAGDSVLAEFASVVNAVQCAVEVQSALKAENATLPPDRRMKFRLGINLGDVMSTASSSTAMASMSPRAWRVSHHRDGSMVSF